MGILKEFQRTITGMAKGLGVTIRNMGRPTITLGYPEQVPDIPDGFRGLPLLLSFPDTETLKCTACELCARACPVDCITIEWTKVDRKTTDPHEAGNNTQTGRKLDVYNLDASLCLYCGLCAEACPWEAIAMSDHYELSATPAGSGDTIPHNPEADGGYPGRDAWDAQLVYDKHRLGDLGRRPQTRLTGAKFNPYLALGGLNIPATIDASLVEGMDEQLTANGTYDRDPKLREAFKAVLTRKSSPAQGEMDAR